MNTRYIVAIVSLLISCAIVEVSAGKQSRDKKALIAYFTSWSIYGRGYSPLSIPADKITHLNYAFAKIVDGKIALADAFADVEKAYPGDNATQLFKGNFWQINHVLKNKYPHLKTLISVGGWTMSTNFSATAATADARQAFARSCVDFVQQYGFDGVDIDWEYPVSGGDTGMVHSSADRDNFSLLMAELRRALGPQRLLTAAVAGSPELVKNLDLPALVPSLDYFNVMAYDFYVPGASSMTAPHSNLYGMKGSAFSVDAAIQAYLKQNVPAQKVVMGIPYYGRAFANVTGANGSPTSVFQPFAGAAAGTFEPGTLNYYNITQNMKNNRQFKKHWDAKAKTSWAFDRRAKTFVAYDSERAVKAKCKYVRQSGLGGIMVWELSQEDLRGAAPLTKLISKQMGI